MSRLYILWSVSIVFIPLLCLSQPLVRFSGFVFDNHSGLPVNGVHVLLNSDSVSHGTYSDEAGFFSLNRIVPGLVNVRFSHVGYRTLIISEIEVNRALYDNRVYMLDPVSIELNEVIVKAERPNQFLDPLVSSHILTVEETKRYPATFYDPARLALHYGGVLTENDQANNLIIRGNSPNGVKWFLEDVEIVNPNHLSNTGTLNDRPAESGGGVNILSAQMLDNSVILKSAFPAEYGNTFSGVMDMHLRKGNPDRFHFTGQLGLLGADLSAEGPFNKDSQSSYLVNYRYSTLGFLSDLGVDLGEETIHFQDLSFSTSFHLKNSAEFSLFGMGGISENLFLGERDIGNWKKDKDRFDIDFESEMGAIGFSYKTGAWHTSVVMSGYDHMRTSSILDQDLSTRPYEADRTKQLRLAGHSKFRQNISLHSELVAGIKAAYVKHDVYALSLQRNYESDADNSYTLLEGYGNILWRITDRLKINSGIHLTHLGLNGEILFEPRFSLQYQSKMDLWSLAYGMYSSVPSSSILLLKDEFGETNDQLGLLRAHHLVAGFTHFFSEDLIFVIEGYYQSLFDLPVGLSAGSFSSINALEYLEPLALESSGSGENVGIDMSLHKYFSNSFFLLANGSIFDSSYKGSDGVRRNTRYNNRFGLSITGGREIRRLKKNKWRTIGLNISATYFGGFWDSPINEMESALSERTIFNTEDAFTVRLPDFFRFDLRLYIKWDHERYSSILGIDIINTTNRINVAGTYWDQLAGKIMEKEYLGLIPMISYRISI